ncbi:MAG: hypothetical protein V1933_01685 [Candidatus Omnitrophota bacterium]
MKAPAFQLYAADFYMDTVGWSATEVGAYFRLLLHEWVSGPLPNNLITLARIGGIDRKTMGKFWITPGGMGGKFSQTNNGSTLENSRLEQTRQEQEEYREKLILSGRTGGLKTQEKKRNVSSNASSNASSEIKALQSSPHNKISNRLFIIPTGEEVAAYCQERKNKINPQEWINHYMSNGWMVGKNKMKDWKASIRVWESQGGNGDGKSDRYRGGKQSAPGAAGRAKSDGRPYPIDAEY